MIQTHKQLTDRLNKAMMDEYIAVSPTQNPLAQQLPKLDNLSLREVVCQYTIFPRSIVSLLSTARDTARECGWNEVDVELTRNIGEELGTETEGLTHYQMLVRGLEFVVMPYIARKLSRLEPNKHTGQFIWQMDRVVSGKPHDALGGTYALECSAVPELVLVKHAIETFHKRATGRDLAPRGSLMEFFDLHIGTWEPDHEEGLRETTAKYVTTEADQKLFEQGFRDVMETMDTWWTGLLDESQAPTCSV